MDALFRSYLIDHPSHSYRLCDWNDCRASGRNIAIPSTRFTGSILSTAYFIAKYSDHRFGAFARHLVRIRHVAESHRHCARLLFPDHHCSIGRFTANRPRSVALYENDRCTNRQIFWKLQWPYALPSIFSGLKIAGTYSVMGAVISEWLGANKGIGVYMTLASSSFKTDRVFVAILLIMILSLTFFAIIALIEKWLLKWQRQGGNSSNG